MTLFLVALFTLFLLLFLVFFLVIYTFFLRLQNDRVERYQRQLIARWELPLLEYLAGEIELPNLVGEISITPRDYDFFVEYLANYLEVLKGIEYERLLDLLRNFGFVEREIKKLRFGRRWERVYAAQYLGLIRERTAIEDLRRALKDPFLPVSFAAALALSRLGATELVGKVVQQLTASEDWNRAKVAEVLLEFGVSAGAQLLTLLDKAELKPSQRALIIRVLGELKYRDALAKIFEIAQQSEDLEEKVSSIKALGVLSYLEARDFLIKMLEDENWVVQNQAAKSLGKIGDPEAIPFLTVKLRDDNWWVRHNAAQALAEIGLEGISVLEKTSMSDKDSYAGEIARQILEESKGRS